MTDRLGYGAVEDRTLPAVVYGLYLLGLTHGLTILIGLILAYANRSGAGARMRTHYTFQIRTFWLSVGWFVVGMALIFWGGIFSLVLIGLPFFALGWIICGAVWLWFLVRTVLGVIYLARDEPYPRPEAWII
ncbi:hypothetical protein DJ021_10205 [Phenylobacterium hankyongense]|uniref:DUF4870 domain-containing protein n=1 Tax=Phenylobacterium hankyongense TaxID=1813876 RepID=A0A328AZS6_9CAUL|nr:hypothetical protein [Phenylobacterium hankyongense]RAK60149.1 hypothetical protein DJ021_10205 [Phenylobacterium hankyongense]